ncbi:hypothetical protein LP419_20730 [Massilia sp. H-1]|nr:hypothetical protein LP419_20730 [Massilia sp. H-1]
MYNGGDILCYPAHVVKGCLMSRSAGERQSLNGTGSIEQFRAIAELHGDIAWIVDCATCLPIYLSPGAAALTGYDLDDILAHFQA